MVYRNVRRIADEFWNLAGGPEAFPRSLEPAAFWALPIAIFKLPRLWVDDAQLWLAEHGILFELHTEDRPLHGCLIANNGRGCILLNGADGAAELRFSLAHEIAHFLLDYHLPRQAAVDRLGPDVLEVFDAHRPPTLDERVHAVLSDVPMGFHSHLMERKNDGGMGCGTVEEREEGADHLALELLAPERDTRRRVGEALGLVARQDRTEIASEILQRDFGLPSSMAKLYGRRLYQSGRTYSVREWLQ